MINFNDEMTQDFLDYSYQTNAERAFPAIDGLKPGQRACVYEMYRKGYLPSKPHVKSAKVSGGVIAELWPHGDTAIYETFARMAQTFINNIPLCEFHGSEGNQIIPEPSSSRYTEVRLSKTGLSMFDGLKKKCVPFIKNFDETTEWPALLPSTLPMLFINGSEGIGTTIAQKFLPYDAKEISEAYKKYLETGEIDYTLAPSFPTGGTIINKDELAEILKTGRGKAVLRAKADIDKNVIKVTEICYQTCVRDLMEEFKKLFMNNELPGVEDIQNMSGKKGVDIRIVCEKGASPNVVLEMLYSKTNLQKTYSANQNLLIDKVPTLINIKDYFDLLYKHNDECFYRECSFDKAKAEKRKEEVEGLLIAFANIDDIISIVRKSDSKEEAKINLIEKYGFTSLQADCILKMTIGQLTKLNGVKLEEELASLKKELVKLDEFLSDKEKRKVSVIERLVAAISKIKTVRKTNVVNISLKKEDKEIATVTPEDVVVIMTQSGNIKRIPKTSFKTQKRNGKGVKGEGDAIAASISTNTIDALLFFTNKGKMYRLLVDNVPVGTNTSKGTNIGTLISLEADEKVIATTSLNRKEHKKYIVFITKKGLIKKTELAEYFQTKRSTGIVAIKLKADDGIANVLFMDEEDLLLITKNGMSIHFETKSIKAIGRNTAGVKSIKLDADDEVLTGLSVNDKDLIAVFSENGLGKKVKIKELPIQGRAGKGLMIYKPTAATGLLCSAIVVDDKDTLLISGAPSSICINASDISLSSRVSQGTMMIKESKIKKVIKL